MLQFIGTAALAGLGGCQQLGGGAGNSSQLSPVLVRIGKTYPDCASGRFLSLADMETAEQAKLFQTVGPDDQPGNRDQPSITILRNRNETGAGGLKAPLGGPDDRLLLNGARTEQLALIRDWSAYHLLIVNLFGPDGGAAVEFSVASGVEQPRRWITTTRLRPGWNTLRYDLAEIGDYVDLRDVRQLAWRMPGAAGPLELYVDDVLITDNTRYQLGENAAPGEMFVYTRGRRTMIGSANRFEFGIANGLISVITDDAVGNLTLRSGLGPLPLALSEDWAARRDDPPAPDDMQMFSSWGAGIATMQTVREATAERVVVEGARRFVDSTAGDDAATSATQVWRYTAYPDGRVFVRVTCDPQSHAWPASRLGFALVLDGRRGFQRIKPAASVLQRGTTGFVLLARQGETRADVLWAPSVAQLAAQQLELTSVDERSIAIVAGDIAAQGAVSTAHLLTLWPRDLDAAPQAESLAGDYQNPATIVATTGRIVTDVDGDLNNDGFNESEGLYEVELAGHVTRFRFDPRDRVRHRPMFRVHGAIGRRAWIYAEGRIIATQWRDAAGELLFVLPKAISSPLSVEVNCGEGR